MLEKCCLNLNRNQKELTPHGTLDFPCAGYTARYTQYPEEVIPWHWHEEIEIAYIEDGRLLMQLPGKSILLGGGDCFFVNSNVLHAISADSYCILKSLVFHPRLMTGEEQSVFARKYVEPVISTAALDGYLFDDVSWRKEPAAGYFQNAFMAMEEEYEGYEFTVRADLSQLILLVYLQNRTLLDTGRQEPEQDHIRIQKMLKLIQEHYAENIGLEDIAKTADIGERECLRCFRRMIGISPMQYLIKYRITQAAAMLLRSRNDSVADISLRCGFDSPSYFSQMFRRFYQCTPREYRINK